VVVAGATWRWWKQVAGNVFSRQALSIIVVYTCFLVLHRTPAHAIGADPADVVTRDGLAGATLFTLGGLVVLRWVLVLGAIYSLATAGMMVWPERAFDIFAATTAMAVVLAALFASREGK